MRTPRFLLVLLAVAFAIAVALLRPLPGRAGGRAAPTRAVPAGTTDTPVPRGVQVGVRDEPHVRRKLAHVRRLSASLAFGERVVGFAKHLLGTPYHYGGSSPRSGFDCSGFVRFVYSHFGVSLPHSSFSDLNLGRRVGRWALHPGDLVFFDGAGHVGIYVGGGRFIHAPHTGTVVRIETMRGWYSERYTGARRIR